MPMPYSPMLLTRALVPPAGEGWGHEPKVDGWRCLAEVRRGAVRLWARSGRDWSDLDPQVATRT